MKQKTSKTRNPVTFLLVFTMTALISACGGGGGSKSDSATSTPPKLSITDATIVELDSGAASLEFELSLSKSINEDITVKYASSDINAVSPGDYSETNGSMTIPAGADKASVIVAINGDRCFEENESFLLSLSNISSNAVLDIASATGTINNDDQKRILTIADVESDEGNSVNKMVFNVSLDEASCFDTEIDFTSNAITADTLDFAISNGSINIPAGDTHASIEVEIKGDVNYESDETLSVNLRNISAHVEATDSEAFGSLLNDDAPALTISSPTIDEGDTGQNSNLIFHFNLEGPTDEISFDYSTIAGSATADVDYTGIDNGALTIAAGQTTASILVEAIGDNDLEPDESFQLQLTNISGFVNLISASANGTLINDDGVTPQDQAVTVGFAWVTEGASGTTTDMIFPVSLTSPSTSPVTVNFETASNGNADPNIDYVDNPGNIVIAAGETEVEINVTINGDDDLEDDESFQLNITSVSGNSKLLTPFVNGLIIDDDGLAGSPRLNVSQASAIEGNTGNTTLVFDVTLTAPSSTEVNVDYTTQNDSALAGSDYISENGSLVFSVGEVTQQIQVTVNGDTFVEATETFNLVMSNLVGDASLNHGTGIGTIVTDDPFALIEIDNDLVIEGDPGDTTELTFIVSINTVAADPVSVDYETQDYSTNVIDDYIYNSGTIVIPPGSTESTVTVSVNGDTTAENDEKLIIALSHPSANAEILVAEGNGTISNDDGDGGWGVPELLEQDPDNDAANPQVAMNSSGAAMAIWPHEAINELESRRYLAGSGWEASTETVTDSTPFAIGIGASERPRLILDESGNAVAVWRQTDYSAFPYIPQVMGNIYTAGSGWGVPVVLYGATDPDRHSIKIVSNASSRVAIVWLAENNINSSYDDVWTTGYDPVNGWDAQPTQLEFNNTELDNHPDIAIDNDDNIIVVWNRHQMSSGSIRDVYVTRYDAQDDLWSPPVTVESRPEDARLPSVVFDANGNAAVLWAQDNPINGRTNIMARFFTTGIDDWAGLAITIDESPGSEPFIDASYNNDGDLFATWQGFTSGSLVSDIRAAHFDASANAGTGVWSAAQLLETDDANYAYYPKVATDELGNAIVVWIQDWTGGNSVMNVRAARFDATANSWQPAESIEITGIDNKGSSTLPQIAMDAAGNATVVWHRNKWDDVFQAYIGIPDIWTVRYSY